MRTVESAEPRDVEDLEIELLLEGIWRRYGYDFREYDRAFMRGRVQARLREENLVTASQLLERVLRSPSSLDGFLDGGTSIADGFCRPAKLWRTLRRKAMPYLRTYPSIRAWAAGNSSEGDLYALLLVLQEELSRSFTVYATDLHEARLSRARSGAVPRKDLPKLAKRYAAAGGRRPLAYYFESVDGKSTLHPNLAERIVFASHNPATDASFNDFHLIVARNAMEGYSDALRARAYELMDESLVRFGFLVLGAGGSLEGMPKARRYKAVDRAAGVYQKTGAGAEGVRPE